ncbi:MAG: BamA/TamA family outer membrane protein [Ruegeria sp.]
MCREADAQSASGVVDTHAGVLEESTKEDSIGFRQGSVVVAPIPFSNPTVGSGLILGAGYLFTLDDGSDPSVLGIAGLKSDNGSIAGGVSLNFNFLENRWHIKTLFAKADVRYDLFTDNGIFPIQQDGILGRFSLSYGVTPDLSLGAAFRYLDTTINPDTPNLPPLPPPYNRFLDTTYGNAGVIAQWDTRDDTIYPTTGHNLEFEATKGYSLEGVLKDYSKAFANYTHYVSPVEDTTIAARFSICGSSSDTPFFDQCGLGTVDAFRGFSATQFLDLNSVSLQIEVRQRLTKRIGVVAFAGTGLVGDGFGNLRDDGPHSAAGLGVRYRVSKKFPLDFSVDLARNDEQENNLYIYVGQRF